MVNFNTPQPLGSDIYCATCGAIDRYNQRRCEDLKLDNKLVTNSWYWSVHLVIFGLYAVYTYNIATQSLLYQDTFRVFLFDLDEEIIVYNLGSRPTIPSLKRTGKSAFSVPDRKHVSAYLFQT